MFFEERQKIYQLSNPRRKCYGYRKIIDITGRFNHNVFSPGLRRLASRVFYRMNTVSHDQWFYCIRCDCFLLVFKDTASVAIITVTMLRVSKKVVKKNRKLISEIKTNKLAIKKYFFYCYEIFPYTI